MKKALPVLASFILLSSCMQDPKPNQDFGPESSVDNLNQALTAANYEATLNSSSQIKTNELVYTESTNQVETLQPVTITLRNDTVTAVGTDATQNPVYTITRNLHQLDYNTNNMKAYPLTQTNCDLTVAGGCDLSVVSLTANAASAVAAAKTAAASSAVVKMRDSLPPGIGPTFGAGATHKKLGHITVQSLEDQAADTTIHWTYHNLSKTYVQIPLPSLVNLRTDCGGRKNPCESPLQAIQVSYDAVDWTSEKYPVKYSYTLIFSPEVPFFSSLIKSCGTTTVPYESERISVTQCEEVKDFTFGHN